MSKTRHLAVGFTLVVTLAGSAAWAAGAPDHAQAAPAHRHAATHSLAARQHAAGVASTALDAMHRHVALRRAAEQRHWIHAGLQAHALDRMQAKSLQASVREIVGEQARLTRRGHETVNEALKVSHRQDVLDWAIRTGHSQFEPELLHDLA